MSEGKPEGTSPGPSKEPVQFPVRSSSNPPPETSVDVALSDLGFMARQAFQERRRQQCFALTRAMLKIDPEHKEARVIQSWVQSDLERELESAKRLYEDARRLGNRGLYTRAETSVRAILTVDPEMQSAQTFLLEMVSQQPMLSEHVNTAYVNAAQMNTAPDEARLPVPQEMQMRSGAAFPKPSFADRPLWQTGALIGLIAIVAVFGALEFRDRWQGQTSVPQLPVAATGTGTLSVTADEGVQVFVNDQIRGTGPLMPPLSLAPGTYHVKYVLNGQEIGREDVVVAIGNITRTKVSATTGRLKLVVFPSTGVQIIVDGGPLVAVTPFLDLSPGQHRLYFWAPGYSPALVTAAVESGQQQDISVTLKPLSGSKSTASAPPVARNLAPSSPPAKTAATTHPTSPAAKTAAPLVAPAPATSSEPGTLAVSASVPVEIYKDDQHLGTTPVTLELPAGTHALEFRFGNLKKTGTYAVRSNEAATATVSFDVTVQINARPWAQVFIDGIQPRALGQTPLSDVRVSVGNVLVFRHPSFPEKRVRVTGGEPSILVVFP